MKHFLSTKFRQRLRRGLLVEIGNASQLIPLSLLAIAVGLLTGGVIALFRWTIEAGQDWILAPDAGGDFSSLPWWARLFLPIVGGLIVGVVLHEIPEMARRVGVIPVMEALAKGHSRLSWKNALTQFFGTAISLISGHSVGREGPGIHLGATAGSLLGQGFRLPNNVNRQLVACGAAAAIAASFNTPLAGVIFSMEVILMEYTVYGFVPVIIAAVVATALIHAIIGSEPIFTIPPMELASVTELPFVFLSGLAMGVCAVIFINSLRFFSNSLLDLPIWKRTTVAGALTGVLALFAPQIMGTSYGSVDGALLGEIGFFVMLLITVAKLLATTAGLGLGLPGGLIGPTIVIGATAGSALAVLGATLGGQETHNHALYTLLGMGSMMGATLQAPLSALVAILELTANPLFILPGMLAIVAACLTASQIFGKESVYLMLLRDRKLEYKIDPVTQYLRRISVESHLGEGVMESKALMSYEEFAAIHDRGEDAPKWLLIENQERTGATVLNVETLNNYFLETQQDPTRAVDLREAPLARLSATPIDGSASLAEALTAIRTAKVDAVYAMSVSSTNGREIRGIITRNAIEQSYLSRG